MTRPTWSSTWMEIAEAIAKRSLCVRAQVGAAVVDSHNRLVAVGYNGPPAGFDHRTLDCTHWCPRGDKGPTSHTTSTYEDCPSLHAEVNALSVCDRSVRLGGTIYVTGHICYNCAKMIANSGLSHVVVRGNPEHSYRAPERSYELLRKSGLQVTIKK